MTAENNKAIADRRSFLKLAGATVVTGSTAVAGATAAVAAVPEAPKPDALYRETEHVRRYYELARG